MVVPSVASRVGRLSCLMALMVCVASTAVLAQGMSEPCVYTADDGAMVITDSATDSSCHRRLPTIFRPPGRLRLTFAVAELISLSHDVAERGGVDHRLVESLVEMESGFNPRAVSRKGAMGLMQLMPNVARQYGVDTPFDPWQNLDAGVRHLRGLLQRYDGDLERSLAAYNAGEGAVRRYGSIPPYAETQNYVRRVLYRYRQRVEDVRLH